MSDPRISIECAEMFRIQQRSHVQHNDLSFKSANISCSHSTLTNAFNSINMSSSCSNNNTTGTTTTATNTNSVPMCFKVGRIPIHSNGNGIRSSYGMKSIDKELLLQYICRNECIAGSLREVRLAVITAQDKMPISESTKGKEDESKGMKSKGNHTNFLMTAAWKRSLLRNSMM